MTLPTPLPPLHAALLEGCTTSSEKLAAAASTGLGEAGRGSQAGQQGEGHHTQHASTHRWGELGLLVRVVAVATARSLQARTGGASGAVCADGPSLRLCICCLSLGVCHDSFSPPPSSSPPPALSHYVDAMWLACGLQLHSPSNCVNAPVWSPALLHTRALACARACVHTCIHYTCTYVCTSTYGHYKR